MSKKEKVKTPRRGQAGRTTNAITAKHINELFAFGYSVEEVADMVRTSPQRLLDRKGVKRPEVARADFTALIIQGICQGIVEGCPTSKRLAVDMVKSYKDNKTAKQGNEVKGINYTRVHQLMQGTIENRYTKNDTAIEIPVEDIDVQGLGLDEERKEDG